MNMLLMNLFVNFHRQTYAHLSKWDSEVKIEYTRT
jgi:hypothetical protein